MEALGQDEETKVGPNKIAQEEEVQAQEPQDLKGGGQEEKEPQTTQKQEQVETILTTKGRDIKNTTLGSSGKGGQIAKPEVGTKPLVVVQVGTTNIIMEKLDVQKVVE